MSLSDPKSSSTAATVLQCRVNYVHPRRATAHYNKLSWPIVPPPLVKARITPFSQSSEREVAERRPNGHDCPRLSAAESALSSINRSGLVGSEDVWYSGGIVRAVDVGNRVVGDLEHFVARNLHL